MARKRRTTQKQGKIALTQTPASGQLQPSDLNPLQNKPKSGVNPLNELRQTGTQDDIPGGSAPADKKRSSGTLKRTTDNLRKPGATTGLYKRSTSASSLVPAQPTEKTKDPGAEIGRIHRSGMSLAMKFSLATGALIVLIFALFGMVIVKNMENTYRKELIRAGYNQLIAFRPTAEKILVDFQIGTNRSTSHFQQSELGQEAIQQLQKLKDANPLIFNITINRAESGPDANPRAQIVFLKPNLSFEPPNEDNEVFVELEKGAVPDPNIVAWSGAESIDGVTVPVFNFRAPLGKDSNASRMWGSLNIAYSTAGIAEKSWDLKKTISIFGALFMLVGVGLALYFAHLIASPVKALVQDIDKVACGDLEHKAKIRSRDEIALLVVAFNRMIENLKIARAQEREVERINGELNLAIEIHSKLMPEKLPNIPNCDFMTCYHCAKEVGGDYYDFFGVDNDNLGFVVADVSGKGIPGSMIMGNTRTILRMMATMNLSPADVLSKTNHWLFRDIPRGKFVTAMYAILNVHTWEMRIASAGHNPMYIWRSLTKSIDSVRPNGIALGFDRGPIFDRTIREQVVKIHPGDRVVMYTDGVVEAMNEAHEEWGDEAFKLFIKKHATLSSKEFVRLLLEALERHKGRADQHDDITVTTFRVV